MVKLSNELSSVKLVQYSIDFILVKKLTILINISQKVLFNSSKLVCKSYWLSLFKIYKINIFYTFTILYGNLFTILGQT